MVGRHEMLTSLTNLFFKANEEKEWWDSFTKLHCPSTYLLMYWTWKKSKVSKHKVKNMYILFKYSKDILFQKRRELSLTIQLQINIHSHIKNRDKRGWEEHFFSCQTSSTICQDQIMKLQKGKIFKQWQVRHEKCHLYPTAASFTNPLDLKFNFYK